MKLGQVSRHTKALSDSEESSGDDKPQNIIPAKKIKSTVAAMRTNPHDDVGVPPGRHTRPMMGGPPPSFLSSSAVQLPARTPDQSDQAAQSRAKREAEKRKKR